MYIHLYNGTVTAGGTDGTQVSEEISSTLTTATIIGSTTITVASAANFYAGLSIKVGTETATITSVDYATNTITFPALTLAHAIGDTVINTSAETNPITTPLSVATGAESAVITNAIRCDAGYATSGSTTITPVGATSAYWALSADATNWGAYGAGLTIANVIGATNILFYAKYKCVVGENPMVDKTVNFNTVATVSVA